MDIEDLSRVNASIERLESHLGLRPRDVKTKPPFFGYTPSCGLHRLKDAWKQMEYLPAQCRWLLDELDVALAATEELAPSRSREQGFQLKIRVQQERPKSGEERKLEWDLYQKWGLRKESQNAEHNLFQRLIGFQVPLYDNVGRDGWDKIDLVGLDSNGVPVVVELKKEDATDMPLRIIMEGVAYAIALKKVWPLLSAELAPLLPSALPNMTLGNTPRQFTVCLLAPENNWKRFDTHFRSPSYPNHWKILDELLRKLDNAGFPVKFGSVARQAETNELKCEDWRFD